MKTEQSINRFEWSVLVLALAHWRLTGVLMTPWWLIAAVWCILPIVHGIAEHRNRKKLGPLADLFAP